MSTIPSTNLFYVSEEAVWSDSLFVSSMGVCASKSTFSGILTGHNNEFGLDVSTVGVSSSFTLHAKDVYGNAVLNVNTTSTLILVRIIYDELSMEIRSYATISTLPGDYLFNVTPTTAGMCSLHSGLAILGGLFATYYSGEIEDSITERVSLESNIDFSGTDGNFSSWPMLTCNSLCSCNAGDCCRAAFSVRWSGLMQVLSISKNSFTAKISTVDDRVRIWIDNSIFVDQWTSLSASDLNFSYDFTVNDLYAVKVEYKQYYLSRGISVFSNSTEGRFSLFAFYEVGQISSISLLPSTLCAASSTFSGTVSLATSSSPANLYIHKRDAFGNSIIDSRTPIVVRLTSAVDKTTSAAVFQNGIDQIMSSFLLTRPGTYTLLVSIPVQMGLSATFYSTDNFTNPITTKENATIQIFSNSNIGNTSCIRWNGFIRPPVTSIYTFQFLLQSNFSRVKLWIDNALIIDKWSSMDSVSPTSMIPLDATRGMVDIFAEYKVDKQFGAWIELRWQYQGIDSEIVSKDNLFVRADLSGSPSLLVAVPGAIGTTTYAVGNALTLATVGLPAVFTVFLRDSYGYNSGNSSIELIVACNATAFTPGGFSRTYHLVPNVGGLLAATGTINSNGSCIVSYIIHSSGIFILDVRVYEKGGLLAMVFLDKYLIGAVYGIRVDPILSIDFKNFNDLAQLPTPTSFSLSGLLISTRWIGLIQPAFNELYWIIAEVSDSKGFGLWINNAEIFSSSGIDHFGRTFMASVPTAIGSIYEIAIEYWHFMGLGKIQLRWRSMNTPETIIPSSQLYFAAVPIAGTPSILSARAGSEYCLAQSTLSTVVGNGMSVASVGITATFAVIIR